VHQGLLFPDGFEILEQALVALRDIDVRRADEFVRRARAAQPNLVNLDVIEESCEFLRANLANDPDLDRCAATLLAVSRDVDVGRLGEEAGHFVDQVLCRYLAREDRDGPFVDGAGRMPWGRVLLILGRPADAHRSLVELVARHQRADLWWALGDAALLVDRAAEANAAFVRALVLDPRAVDCFRLRYDALRKCYQELRARHDSSSAREMLLPSAWIAGALEIVPGNRWVEAATNADPGLTESSGASPEARSMRRFTRLMFADRTAGSNSVDIARREEMATLAPDLFVRYVDACRRREAP
jgi:hypothetical protein